MIDELEKALALTADAFDVSYLIDEANTVARADLVVDGKVIAEQLPATFLLQLEKRLREVRLLFKDIPTFDPVRTWHPDATADKTNVLRADPVVTLRKQRTRKYNVMYDATKEHPAQIDVVEVDEPMGEIRAYDWTGMISPGKKAALLQTDRRPDRGGEDGARPRQLGQRRSGEEDRGPHLRAPDEAAGLSRLRTIGAGLRIRLRFEHGALAFTAGRRHQDQVLAHRLTRDPAQRVVLIRGWRGNRGSNPLGLRSRRPVAGHRD